MNSITKQYTIDQPHTLQELAVKTLHHHCLFTRRAVQVEIKNQDIYLYGEVQSFYQKQLAQEALRNLEGIGQIRNQLQVAKSA